MSHRYIVVGPDGPLAWTSALSPERAVERFLPGLSMLWEVATREGYRVDPMNGTLIATAQADTSPLRPDFVLP